MKKIVPLDRYVIFPPSPSSRFSSVIIGLSDGKARIFPLSITTTQNFAEALTSLKSAYRALFCAIFFRGVNYIKIISIFKYIYFIFIYNNSFKMLFYTVSQIIAMNFKPFTNTRLDSFL